MVSTPKLVAVDWGTSSLRAALMDGDGAVIERRGAPDGLMTMTNRRYPDVLAAFLAGWPALPVLMSGMVGSRQGWAEAPYVACPAGFADLASGIVPVDAPGLGRAGIVPGLIHDPAGGAPDVLRGEEVQVFGALALGLPDGVFVLPGTHSKWVGVENGRVTRFHTFMTGEVFGLLRRHSILGRLMPEAEKDSLDRDAFLSGAAAAQAGGAVLHGLFSARTLGLTDRLPSAALPGYLSGLLIGEELREGLALFPGTKAVHLICRDDLAALYGASLAQAGIASETTEDAGFSGLHGLARMAGWID